MAKPRVLLVDDEPVLLSTLAKILTHHDFEVTTAQNVREALGHISAQPFDVLLSDLHMPGAGDGLTVVSAMRHANPHAVTMLLSAFPEMDAASQAILMQADEILVKPMNVPALIDVIKQRLAAGPSHSRVIETVAQILARSTDSTIQQWFRDVEADEKMNAVELSFDLRTAHLPQLFRDLVRRLGTPLVLGSSGQVSPGAHRHGVIRRDQGYTAAMMVEESRMLQVNIFRTLQKNLNSIDFTTLLVGVMAIADEVDAQLAQAMESYIAQSLTDALPG